MRASVVLRVFCTLVVAALAPSPAAAHLNSTGLGPIYDGAAHFLTSPDDLLAVLALSLWAGLRGASYGRHALFTLPGAWLLGSLVGMTALGAVGGGVVSAFWLMGLGTLLAADVTLSPRVAVALAALLGVQRGYLNGAGMEPSASAVVALCGLGAAVFVLVAAAAALVVVLRAAWARVAVRVIGSWVAASGLLLLGWSIRAHS